jgi:JAB domain-containing protein similar to deubiquitination enzymes
VKGFLSIKRIIVPREAIAEAHAHLRRVGRAGFEGFALWAGVSAGQSFMVRQTVIPTQKGIKAEKGVCVRVESEELHRINVWLYEHRYTLIAQIHSHPTDAYHSETDDEYPIVTTLGGISIVVSDFAQRSFTLEECAVYRLTQAEGWVELSAMEVNDLIRVE